ncbi:O-antigen ligase family protein [Candidatus Uhrbacteria bacterium]|nr:O-antigen ligase family protein [Candidatus Uhrbacteria bacterium]
MRHRRLFATVLGTGIALDLLSFIGWSAPAWSTMIALFVIALVAIGAFVDIRIGVVAVLLELLWGSHGYLLRIPAGGLDLSLRTLIFCVVIAATAWHLRIPVIRRTLWDAIRSHPVRWPALVFLATLVLGLLLGLIHHPFDLVFFDANAWGFLALAPAFLIAMQRRSDGQHYSPIRTNKSMVLHEPEAPHNGININVPIIHDSLFIILAGALYLILRSYTLLFFFSHDLGGTWMPLYQWVRDTRLGEVTIFPGAFPRVFMPSMVLLFPAVLRAGMRMIHGFSPSHREGELEGVGSRILTALVFGGGVAVLFFSLSRSYWLAGVVLIVMGTAWAILVTLRQLIHKSPGDLSQFRTKLRKVVRSVAALGGAVTIAIGLALVAVRLPYPKPLTTAGIGDTLLARFSADAAVSNRWQQIGPLRDAIMRHPILGNGFGAAVTYETKDPRTLTAYPDGKYTTTAFEWGYLDDLLERGLIGLIAELWFISALIWYGLRGGGETTALALGFFAVAIIHVTSPYLNHPLGIGLILWLCAVGMSRNPEEWGPA